MESQDNDLNNRLNNDFEAEPPPDLTPEELQGEDAEVTEQGEISRTAPATAKKPKAPLVIGIVALVVFLCIVCVVSVVLLRPYLPLIGAKQAAPRIIPADTDFFAAVNVDVEDKVGYRHLVEVYGDIQEIEEAIDELLEEIENQLGISYKEDVKPWLGPEVAIAITNMEEATEDEAPVFIIAAGTLDTKASDAFLQKIQESVQDRGYDVDEATYKNVTYSVAEPENDRDTPLFFGTLKKFVILTVAENAMEDVIDVVKGDSDSLADNERYTELVGVLPRDAVSYVYLNMEDVRQASLKGFEGQGFELPKEASEQLEAFQALGLALTLGKEGIQVDGAMTFDPDALPQETMESFEVTASPNRILKRIPDDALGFLSGQDLATAWKSAFASLANVPDAQEQLEAFGAAVGLKIDEELLHWLSGEFAIALVEARGIEDAPVGGFAVFEVDDQEGAEDTLKNITRALELMAGWELEGAVIGDVEMQVLRDAYSEEITLGYGFTDKYLVIGFSEDALENAVDDDIEPIADDDIFEKVQRYLPEKTAGYFYVNVKDVWRLAYRNMSDAEKENFNKIRPYLEPVEATGMAVPLVDPKKGVSQSTLFIYIPGE